MARKKKIIIGNWKMHPDSSEEAKTIFAAIKRYSLKWKNSLVVVCPPMIFLEALAKNANNTVKLGAQDVFWENETARTGQISPKMVRKAGAKYVILGHSEMRNLGDTDQIVANKIKAAASEGLCIVLCVGEITRDADGAYLEVIKNQLLSSLVGLEKKDLLSKLIIAYEPVWEIGRKDMQAMKPSEIHEIVILFRKVLNDAFGPEVAKDVPILYGGSVDSHNALEVLKDGEVGGLLLGRSSLEPETMKEILKSADGLR